MSHERTYVCLVPRDPSHPHKRMDTHTRSAERDLPVYVREEALLAPTLQQLKHHELDRETPEIRLSPLLHVTHY